MTQTRPLYRSYVFRDKDPVIDELRTLVKDHFGALTHTELRLIHEAGGPTPAAMAGWFFGTTLRPQSPSVEAAGRSVGYKRVWVKLDGSKGGRRRRSPTTI